MTIVNRYLDDNSTYFEDKLCRNSGSSRAIRPFENNTIIFELKNVYIDTSNGVVYDENHEIISELLNDYLMWLPDQIWGSAPFCHTSIQTWSGLDKQYFSDRLKRAIDHINKYGPIPKHFSEACLIGRPIVNLIPPRGKLTFGHVFDLLQRLIAFEFTGVSLAEALFLIPPYYSILGFDRLSMAFGMPLDRVMVSGVGQRMIFCEKVFYPVSPSYYTHISDFVHREYIIKKIRDPVLNRVPVEYQNFSWGQSYPEGLYLARNHISRGVENESILLDQLINHGFCVLTGCESFDELVFLFSNAKKIIAPHGSMLVNSIYCSEECKILEFEYFTHKNDRSFERLPRLSKEYNWVKLKLNDGEKVCASSFVLDINRVFGFNLSMSKEGQNNPS